MKASRSWKRGEGWWSFDGVLVESGVLRRWRRRRLSGRWGRPFRYGVEMPRLHAVVWRGRATPNRDFARAPVRRMFEHGAEMVRRWCGDGAETVRRWYGDGTGMFVANSSEPGFLQDSQDSIGGKPVVSINRQPIAT